MKLSICVPSRDEVHIGFTRSLCNLTNRLTKQNVDFDLHIVCGSVIIESRTALVKEALENNATHTLWLDSDMHFPANVFDKLYEHQKDIVAAQYSTRYAPYRTVAFTDCENADNRLDASFGLHKVWAVGMGCMLVNTDVYNNLPKPWFDHEYNKRLDTFSGEDIYFCNQAMHHGYEVWIDASIELAHFGTKANIL